MNELITVNNTEIEVKEYEGKRVVTVWDIAKVHGREVKRITENFKNNRNNFIEHEDFFSLTPKEFYESKFSFQKFIPNNVKEIVLFTESGYLLLVKTFTDDLSWDIQRQLVKTYFRFKEAQKTMTLPQQLLAQAQCLVEMDNRITVVENKVDNEIRVNSGEQLRITKAVKRRVCQRIDLYVDLIGKDKFMYQAIYRDLKDRFGVASYKDIKRKDLTDCLNYISTWIEPFEIAFK
jgi:toxin-antitoxin system, toxin component, bro family